MLDESVDARLSRGGFFAERPRLERFRVFGISESGLQDLCRAQGEPPPGTAVRFRVDDGEIELDFLLPRASPAESHRILDEYVARLEKALGIHVVARERTTLLEWVARRLIADGRTLAVAESCTGGLLGHYLTEIPGISAVFLEDAVTYSNDAKVRRLGVAPALLETHGAVSEEVVRAMAMGAREAAGAELGLATSGVLGPSGGSESKPVGLVWTALATSDGVTSWRREFPGDRSFKKILAAKHALDRLRRHLLGVG